MHEAGDRDRPEPVRLRRELPDGDEEERERRCAEERDLHDRQLPARQLASGGARVARVDAGVDQPVQRHRERTRADHRERDPDEVVRRRRPADREERADVGERQREDRVLDLHEPREARGQRRERRRRGGHGRHATGGSRAASGLAVGQSRCARRGGRAHASSAGREHGVAVAAAAGRAGEVDDERAADRAGGAAREQGVRRLVQRVGTQRLRDARRLALEHVARRLGRDVARERGRCRRS